MSTKRLRIWIAVILLIMSGIFFVALCRNPATSIDLPSLGEALIGLSFFTGAIVFFSLGLQKEL